MTIARSQKNLGAPGGLGDCSHKRGIDVGLVYRISLRRHDKRLKDTDSVDHADIQQQQKQRGYASIYVHCLPPRAKSAVKV